MDIMELGALGELVGGVAVIASLIYVGLQVRHSAASARVTSATAVSEGFNEAMEKIIDPHSMTVLRQAVVSGVEELTPEERFRFGAQMFIMYCHLETVYYQVKAGIAEPYVESRLRNLTHWIHNTPGVLTWWHGNIYDERPGEIRRMFTPEFQSYVANIEVPEPGVAAAGT